MKKVKIEFNSDDNNLEEIFNMYLGLIKKVVEEKSEIVFHDTNEEIKQKYIVKKLEGNSIAFLTLPI